MSIWSKVITALRGGVSEAGEAIADTQALRILDQEIRDATGELNDSKASLAEMMARQKVAENKCSTINSKIAEFEDFALQALDKNDEALAVELADKIANLEKQLNTEQNACTDFTTNTAHLRDATKLAERNIAQLKHQVETARATENVQRARATVAQRQSASNSKLATAMESLERIKQKQELQSAQLNAEQEIATDTSKDSLDDRLEAAGIISGELNGDSVLARLKHKATLRIESGNHLEN